MKKIYQLNPNDAINAPTDYTIFTKADLINGFTVTLRNGKKYLHFNIKGYGKVFINNNEIVSLKEYSKFLTHSTDKMFDVVEVRRPQSLNELLPSAYNNQKIVWSTKENKEKKVN